MLGPLDQRSENGSGSDWMRKAEYKVLSPKGEICVQQRTIKCIINSVGEAFEVKMHKN